MEDKIGYYLNNGGLNNQKLALLGLFIAAFRQKKTMILPVMYDKNVPLENNSYLPLENPRIPVVDVFDADGIERLAKKYDLTIDHSNPQSLKMGGWDYFSLGAESVGALALSADETVTSAFVRDFFLEVVPLARRSYIVSQLKQDIFRRKRSMLFRRSKPVLAAQLHIGSNWQFYSAVTLKPTVGDNEDFCIGYEPIMAKIKKTIPDAETILVICDESDITVSKEEIRKVCREKFGFQLLWKSDFLSSFEMKALGPLALSMIDFELAMSADKFVGLSRSTFSNMVTFEKFVATRSQITTDFIYNNNRAELDRRTDNGGHPDPSEAVK